jgi:hypothetical protein
MPVPEVVKVGPAALREIVIALDDFLGHSRFGTGLKKQRPDPPLIEARIEVHPGTGEQPFATRLHPVDYRVDAIGDLVVKLPVQRQQIAVPVPEVVKKTPLG